MDTIRINEKISYIEASDDPLSADIGIIREPDGLWLYDVGNGAKSVASLDGRYRIVLSHFHADHTGNLGRVRAEALYVSKETYDHVHQGTIVREGLTVGSLRIFPLPSSHCKGNLGLEIDGTYAFVGDALYSKVRDGCFIFNAQLLKDEIDALSGLRAPWLLVSHWKGLIRKKDDVIGELKALYATRKNDSPEISVKIQTS